MTFPRIKAPSFLSLPSLGGKIIRTVATVICCSGAVEVILQEIGQRCIVTCIISMVIALASQVAAST